MENQMNKYEEALNWLTWRCMEPNDDYEGLVCLPYFTRKSRMYIGMKKWIHYTLEELGL